jgi:hypothetical protein
MSLTSYRAAPPRGEAGVGDCDEKGLGDVLAYRLGRPGGDLLSRALRRSTIGPEGLNDRVRNGIGWGPPGKTTRSTKPIRNVVKIIVGRRAKLFMSFDKNDQADRAISTSKLHASRHFHTWPINVVVYHGSRRSLVLRLVSRLDAFSGYLFHT